MSNRQRNIKNKIDGAPNFTASTAASDAPNFTATASASAACVEEVKGLEYCHILLDPKSIVTDEEPLQFFLAAHGINYEENGRFMTGKNIDIFRFGFGNENKNSPVTCANTLRNFKTLMDRANTAEFKPFIHSTVILETKGKLYENLEITNYQTNEITENAGLYVYYKKTRTSESILTPFILFNKNSPHRLFLSDIGEFMDFHFDKNRVELYTVMCRNYYGSSKFRMCGSKLNVNLNRLLAMPNLPPTKTSIWSAIPRKKTFVRYKKKTLSRKNDTKRSKK